MFRLLPKPWERDLHLAVVSMSCISVSKPAGQATIASVSSGLHHVAMPNNNDIKGFIHTKEPKVTGKILKVHTHKQLNMENAWKRHDFPSKNLVLNFLVPSKSLFFQLPWSFVSSPGTIWRPSSWLRSFGTRWDLNSDTWFRIAVFYRDPH